MKNEFRELDVSPGKSEVKQGKFIELISTDDGLFKAAYSVTFDIFRNFLFSFYIICKSRIKLFVHNKSVHYS